MRRSGSATRSIGRATATRRRRARSVPCWPASSPHESRSSVPALPQSIGPSGARRPRSPTPWTRMSSSPSSVDLDAERAHGVDRRLGVGGAPEAADPALALGDRAEQHRAVRDRLVARDGDGADERGPARSSAASRSACPSRRRTSASRRRSRRTPPTGICCGPSQSASSGRGCASTMIPSAPTATAARASGSTRSRRPAACDGSTITGRCVSCFSTATGRGRA